MGFSGLFCIWTNGFIWTIINLDYGLFKIWFIRTMDHLDRFVRTMVYLNYGSSRQVRPDYGSSGRYGSSYYKVVFYVNIQIKILINEVE